MRPTFSIIFFTVISGAGYGLWFLLGLGSILLWPESRQQSDLNTTLSGFVVGFVLVSSGLVSSLWHLGKPLRAWRAFSQWRSSWLSREGVAAVLTYLPVVAIVLAMACDFRIGSALKQGGVQNASPWMQSPTTLAASILLVIGSFVTVWCTAHIYASIKPVRAWHNRQVVFGYLLLALYTGGLFAWALTSIPDAGTSHLNLLLPLIAAAAIAGAIQKSRYWRLVDEGPALTTGDATGLGSLGTVRSFEQPHTEENYLTHEMGFRLARKHSQKLRTICLISGFAVPGILALLGLIVPALATPAAWLALFSGMGGIFIERWLFFAEAKHTVMLYYGARNG